MSDQTPVILKKRTFLSSVALGLSSLAITFVICCTVLIMYGLHFAGERTDRVISLAQNAVQGLPTLLESLPPAAADMLNDRRQPDYGQRLAIKAQLITRPGSDSVTRTGIEIVNNGNEVVSVLALRILVLDEHGQLRSETQEWAATPFAAENPWRGPIMPGSRRYFECPYRSIDAQNNLKAEVEINELRIWNGSDQESASGIESAPEIAVPSSTVSEVTPEV